MKPGCTLNTEINFNFEMDRMAQIQSGPLLTGKAAAIAEKINAAVRLDNDDALWLYEKAPAALLAMLASQVSERFTGSRVFFNINAHLEPSNICVNRCKFCEYARSKEDQDSYTLSDTEIIEIAQSLRPYGITEIHVTGGVHPDKSLDDYCHLLNLLRQHLPGVHIKAFTAEEINYISKKQNIPINNVLLALQQSGLQSIPGGGAEIFSPSIRKILCPEKLSGEHWLMIHRTAHLLGIKSNATMLFGHIESYTDRIKHMEMLRHLQDETGGFNSFIPLTYIPSERLFIPYEKQSMIDELRNFAVARLYLDNFAFIKAYWPMTGIDTARLSLFFGVNDLDGTLYRPTGIYRMKQSMTKAKLIEIIHSAGKIPIERDSLYNPLKEY